MLTMQQIKLPNLVLFKHTLRMDNANWHTYVVRLSMIIFTLFSMAQIQTTSAFTASMKAPGLQFFQALTVINLIFIYLYAISFFSSAITEEREANTFSLLMMTGLSPFTMLLSKSSGRLMSGLMLLLVQLPFTVLAVTLGGISLNQIFASYILLISLMFFLNNLALFFSIVAKKSSTAGSLTFLYLLCYSSGIGYLSYVLTRKGFFSLTPYLLPFERIGEIFNTGFNGYLFDWSSAINILQGVIFFLLSWLLFNKFAWEKQEQAPVSLTLRHSKKTFLRFFKVSRPWKHAISWKEFYFTVGGRGTIIGSIILMSIFVIGMVYAVMHFDANESPAFMPDLVKTLAGFLIGTGIAVTAIMLMFIASSIFSNDMWAKTIQEIYTIPNMLRNIVLQKIWGALLIIIPSLVFAVIGFFLLFLTSPSSFDFVRGMGSFMILSGVIKFIFFLHIVAYMSLHLKHGVIIVSGIVYGAISAILSIPTYSLFFFGGTGSLIFSYIISSVISVAGICFTYWLIRKKLLALIENPGQ